MTKTAEQIAQNFIHSSSPKNTTCTLKIGDIIKIQNIEDYKSDIFPDGTYAQIDEINENLIYPYGIRIKKDGKIHHTFIKRDQIEEIGQSCWGAGQCKQDLGEHDVCKKLREVPKQKEPTICKHENTVVTGFTTQFKVCKNCGKDLGNV